MSKLTKTEVVLMEIPSLSTQEQWHSTKATITSNTMTTQRIASVLERDLML